MDDRHRLELLDAAAQRDAEHVGHEVDRHRVVADLVQDPGQPRILGVRERDDDDVHRTRVEDGADVLRRTQPRRPGRAVELVAEDPEHADADVAPFLQHPHDLRRRLAAAHDHRVALVVPAPARDPQRLAEGLPPQIGGRDRHDPEDEDDGARIVVTAEDEAHDGDEDQRTDRGGLADVLPLGQS